jgi:diguanylate cyclase (GGDEF)-like protein/PAS domain S-box-containing protein/putative nucleotidyltransferase with HDIG domain
VKVGVIMKSKLVYIIAGLVFLLTSLISWFNEDLFHMIIMLFVLVSSINIALFIFINMKFHHKSIALVAYGFFISGIFFVFYSMIHNGLVIGGFGGYDGMLKVWFIAVFALAFSLPIRSFKLDRDNLSFIKGLVYYLVLAGMIVLNFTDLFTFYDGGFTTTYYIFYGLNIVILSASVFMMSQNKNSYRSAFYKHIFVGVVIQLLTNVVLVFSFENRIIVSNIMVIVGYGYFIYFIAYIRYYIMEPIRNNFDNLLNYVGKLQHGVFELSKNEQIFKQLYEEAPVGYQSLDQEGNLILVNDAYARMLGYEKSEMLGKFFGDFMDEESLSRLPNQFKSFINKGTVDVIFNMRHKNGTFIPTRFLGRIASKDDGTFKQTHCIVMDVSGEVEYQRGIVESKNKLDELIEELESSVYISDKEERCVYVNDAALRNLGYEKDEVIGKNIHELIHYKSVDGAPLEQYLCPLYKAFHNGLEVNHLIQTFWKKDGTSEDVTLSTRLIKDSDGAVLFTVVEFNSVDSNCSFTESLVRMSYHDSLTGLYNRRYFQEEIEKTHKEAELPLTIVVADVNGLKLINDAFGHHFGDAVLKKVSEIFCKIKNCYPMVFRVGGDEFVLIMRNKSAKEAEGYLKKIKETLQNEQIGGVELSISFGAKTKTHIDQDLQELYRDAEDLMYQDKLLYMQSSRSNLVDSILVTLNEKDNYSEQHSRTVSEIAAFLASNLGFSSNEVAEIKTAGLLHDIGKIIIPSTILNKEGLLTPQEYDEMKKHSEIGYRILNSVQSMRTISEIVLYHHERIDGKGYPKGLHKVDIPIQSRIISVADAIEAMGSDRSYRKALSKDTIIKELADHNGTQFCPDVVKVALSNIDEIMDIVYTTKL